MVASSLPGVSGTLAPTFEIEVNNEPIGAVRNLIRQVEYESADGLADVARISLTNPDGMVSDRKIFQPGNEFSLFGGYGNKSQLTHIGRVRIIKNVPNFPQDGMPTMVVTGYTRDSQMMDNAPKKPPKGSGKNKTVAEIMKGDKQKGKGGRVFRDMAYDEIVEARAGDYDFAWDIDIVPGGEKRVVQKVGVSDYDFVQGIANITGFSFWVDADEKGKWTLHFRDPAKLKEFGAQEKEHTFEYDFVDGSSLLSFVPELLVKDSKTNILVTIKDKEDGTIIRAEVEEDNTTPPEMDATGDQTAEVQGEYTSASSIKLQFNDYSFDVISNRRFTLEAEAIEWAQQWFRRMKQNFILSRGKIIGVEDLMARQIHNLKGIGKAYDGRYYFSRVKHIFSDSAGYTCDVGCRKEVQ